MSTYYYPKDLRPFPSSIFFRLINKSWLLCPLDPEVLDIQKQSDPQTRLDGVLYLSFSCHWPRHERRKECGTIELTLLRTYIGFYNRGVSSPTATARRYFTRGIQKRSGGKGAC